MVSSDYELYQMEAYTPSFGDSRHQDAAGLLLKDLKDLIHPKFSDLLQVLQKVSFPEMCDHPDLQVIKCLYHELRGVINGFHQSVPSETEEDRLKWVEFYQELSKVIHFNEYAELWQTAAFLLQEESLDFCGESSMFMDQLGLLIHLKCFQEDITIDDSSFHELKKLYQVVGLNTYLVFLARSSHKLFVISSIARNLEGEVEPIISDDSALSLCKEVADVGASLSMLVKVFKRFQLSKEVIPGVVECLLNQISSEHSLMYEDQIYILDLIITLDCHDFWVSITDKMKELCNQSVDYCRDPILKPSSYTKLKKITLLKLWKFMLSTGDCSPRIDKCLFKYFFLLMDQHWSAMSLSDAKETITALHEITVEIKDIDQIKECVSVFLIYLTVKVKYPHCGEGTEVSKTDIIPFLSDLFASIEIEPRHLQDALELSARFVQGVGLKISFIDFFQDLVALFQYSIFEDRRDLAFYLLASRHFSDDSSKVLKICPRPIHYAPPYIADRLFQALKSPFLQVDRSVEDKEQLLISFLNYYRFNGSQMTQLITWACQSNNEKDSLSLNEYSSLLQLVCTCLTHVKPMGLSDDQRPDVIRALKPRLYVHDFRIMYRQDDPDPMSTFLYPTLKKLEVITEKLDLLGNSIVENHYYYWNEAIRIYLTNVVPDLIAKASAKRPMKRKGKKFYIYPAVQAEHMKSVARLPFDRLQKDLMRVGNSCMLKLIEHPLYRRCSYFQLDSA